MSSNIVVHRICQQCGNQFEAKTTVTKFCSKSCNGKAHKAKARNAAISISNTETATIIGKPMQELKAKEFLTVKEVAKLLSCSIRTVYNYVDAGKLNAINLSERLTRIRRTDIDKLFEQPTPPPEPKSPVNRQQIDMVDCCSLNEVKAKYSISDKALHDLIKRNEIQKLRKGKEVFVPKEVIEKILG